MTTLLDACVIIWWMTGDARLGPEARALLASASERLATSLFTIFEIELKQATGKLRLPDSPLLFLEKFDIDVYSPSANELHAMLDVSIDHGDPFDRTLVGLGSIKSWRIVTSDEALLKKAKNIVTMIDSRK